MHDPDPVCAGMFSAGRDHVKWLLWRAVQSSRQLHSEVLRTEFNGFGRIFLLSLLTVLPDVIHILIGCVC